MTAIVLLRHGETHWDREHRIHGHAPVSLTDAGREAVERVGQELAATGQFDRVHAASTPAARETADILRLAGVDPRPQFEPAWRPRDAGVFQGCAYERLELADLHTVDSLTDVDVLQALPSEGENLPAARDRVLDRWTRLCETAATDERVLVVTHDFPIATILGTIAGADPVNDLGDFAPGECSTTTVRLAPDDPTASETRVEDSRFANS